jgi:hypothetical protein
MDWQVPSQPAIILMIMATRVKHNERLGRCLCFVRIPLIYLA